MITNTLVELLCKTDDSRTDDSKAKTGSSKTKTDNSKAKTRSSKAKTDDPKAETDDSKSETDDSKAIKYSQALIDAENTIKYTLLLDYSVPEVDLKTPRSATSKISEIMFHCCKIIYPSLSSEYNFFGSIDPTKLKDNNFKNLLSMDSFSLSSVSPQNITDKVSFHSMILQNSVMQAYHTILTELFGEQSVRGYTLANFDQSIGIRSALKKKYINMDSGIIKSINFPKGNLDSKKKSSKAAGFNSALKRRFNECQNFSHFLYHKGEDENNCYYLQFYSLYKSFKKIPLSSIKLLFSDNESSKSINNFYNTFFKALWDNAKNFTPPVKNLDKIHTENLFKDSIVDGMYHYYIAERCGNFNLFYYLLHLILIDLNNTKYSGFSGYLASFCSLCQKLPNPFSRPYFIKFAFDHINDETKSYRDFWSGHDIRKREVVADIVPDKERNFSFDKWASNFKLFVDYMSDWLIPLYDWCFISMLLHVIENNYSGLTPHECLEKAFYLLAEYIEENYLSILRPASFSPDSKVGRIDILCEKNILRIKDQCKNNTHNMEILSTLYQSFFNYYRNDSIAGNTELNLRLFSPNTIKEKSEFVLRDVNNLYLDFLLNSFSTNREM